MNQKAFAILVGAIMILSAFAGFVLRGGDESQPIAQPTTIESFGVQGRLVDWSFESLSDVLQMSPESTTGAYWLNLSVSSNLTDAAREALPESFGLTSADQLYPVKIQRLASAQFNGSLAEFHWIAPFPVAYEGLVFPYKDFMMIPIRTRAGYVAVMGRPTLFGPQSSLESILDVITGGFSTDRFTLAAGEAADLQVAMLGKASGLSKNLSSDYRELYVGVSQLGEGYDVTASYLAPDAGLEERARGTANKYGLRLSSEGSSMEMTGRIGAGDLKELLPALLRP
jgi:hypothetical protein